MVLLPQMAAQAGYAAGGALLGKLAQAVSSGTDISSLTDLGKVARVEPLVLIDKSLGDQPYMADVMKTTLTIFAGYYVQAISMITNVGRIDTLKVLDALNPNRTAGIRNVRDAVWSKEAYDHGLPSMESFEQPMEPRQIVSFEAFDRSAGVDDNEAMKKLYEAENLATGKMISIELKDGKHSAKIPVSIRLVPSIVPAATLTHIFTATAKNNTWKERYHLWRAGQITLVRDLMFSVDLIDQHRKALINDTTNVYMSIHDRKRNNVARSVSSGTPSMADASNIAVISKATAKEIGRALYGKIENVEVRKRIFDTTYLMLMVVVDEEWERVTIYHRGIDQPTEASFRDIKASEKGKGPDITEILKAYALGSTPNL